MGDISYKDLKDIDSFEKFGELFKKICADDDNHIYVFRREKQRPDKMVVSYEVVRGVKYKNPNGSIVYHYPSSEQFGTYGFYIVGPEEYCKKRIEFRKEYLKKS